MIKQIKPGSLSHKFLKLLYDDWDLERGVNVCEVFWTFLGKATLTLLVGGLLLFLGLGVLVFVVGLVLALLAPFFQYSPLMANLAWSCWGFACMMLLFSAAGSLLLAIQGEMPVLPTWWKKPEEDTSPPSLLSIWWASVKEKTCVKIVVSSDK
jgi:hypothetical protein